MKQLLTLLCFACILFSCSTIKRTNNKMQTSTDTTGAKSSTFIDVKKKDTSGTSLNTISKTKSSDSTYSRTTTIKEYFTDEFGEEDAKPNSKKDSNAVVITHVNANDYLPAKEIVKSPGSHLKYRETTIVEEGLKKELETSAMLNSQTAQIKSFDSNAHEENQTSNVKTTTSSQVKTADIKRTLPGFGIGAGIGILALIVVCYLFRINPFALIIGLFRRKENK